MITVHYNPECAKCRREAAWTRRLDWLGRVVLSTEPSPVGPVPKGSTVVVDHGGVIRTGIDATWAICRQIPAYWPLALVLALPPLRRFLGRKDGGGCEGGACDI
ncbi:MAG: DUF393 domain-containing protein [Alphaproteobacteria bacterium]|nr:MAG: DUF393 domain-containing protein [Alphaproteobacteria bacterium]